MLLGVTTIQATLTKAYESGIYRVTDMDQRFLLFSFNNQKEAINCGSALAKLLGVPFKNTLPAEQTPSQIGCNMEPAQRGRKSNQSDLAIISEAILGCDGLGGIASDRPMSVCDSECPSKVPETSVKPKTKKVMGVSKQVSELVKNGKKDDEIIEVLLPLYVDAGRQEAEARDLISWYISDARKGK